MEHILIVEDDNKISVLLKEALEREGFACGQAFSGTECMLRLSLEQYQLILLDLTLPGQSGEDVLQALRGKGITTPVIVVSARDDLDSKVDVLSIGADDYVTKPFEIKEVVARIRVQLRKAGDSRNASHLTYRSLVLDREHHGHHRRDGDAGAYEAGIPHPRTACSESEEGVFERRNI